MAKYFIINECKGDTFIHAISATTRADAFREAVDDFLSLTKFEQWDGRKVCVAEADPAHYSNVVFLVKGGKHRSMSKLFWEVR